MNFNSVYFNVSSKVQWFILFGIKCYARIAAIRELSTRKNMAKYRGRIINISTKVHYRIKATVPLQEQDLHK